MSFISFRNRIEKPMRRFSSVNPLLGFFSRAHLQGHLDY